MIATCTHLAARITCLAGVGQAVGWGGRFGGNWWRLRALRLDRVVISTAPSLGRDRPRSAARKSAEGLRQAGQLGRKEAAVPPVAPSRAMALPSCGTCRLHQHELRRCRLRHYGLHRYGLRRCRPQGATGCIVQSCGAGCRSSRVAGRAVAALRAAPGRAGPQVVVPQAAGWPAAARPTARSAASPRSDLQAGPSGAGCEIPARRQAGEPAPRRVGTWRGRRVSRRRRDRCRRGRRRCSGLGRQCLRPLAPRVARPPRSRRAARRPAPAGRRRCAPVAATQAATMPASGCEAASAGSSRPISAARGNIPRFAAAACLARVSRGM